MSDKVFICRCSEISLPASRPPVVPVSLGTLASDEK